MKWDREKPNGIRAFLKCKAPLQTYFSFDELLQTLFQALCHKVCKVSEVEDLMASRPIAYNFFYVYFFAQCYKTSFISIATAAELVGKGENIKGQFASNIVDAFSTLMLRPLEKLLKSLLLPV